MPWPMRSGHQPVYCDLKRSVPIVRPTTKARTRRQPSNYFRLPKLSPNPHLVEGLNRCGYLGALVSTNSRQLIGYLAVWYLAVSARYKRRGVLVGDGSRAEPDASWWALTSPCESPLPEAHDMLHIRLNDGISFCTVGIPECHQAHHTFFPKARNLSATCEASAKFQWFEFPLKVHGTIAQSSRQRSYRWIRLCVFTSFVWA